MSQDPNSPIIDLLLVEDKPGDIRLVREALRDAHPAINLHLAANGVEALQFFEDFGPPDFVLTDVQMPVMHGLKLVETIERIHPGTPVILMTDCGTEDVTFQTLRKGASSYVSKANIARDLVNTLQGVLDVSGTERQYQRMLSGLQQISTRIVLENDPSLVPTLIAYLDDHLNCLGFTDEIGLIRIGIALREALLNAMFHGNLELESEQLTAALQGQSGGISLPKLIAERQAMSPYRDRKVFVDVQMSRQSVSYTIRDEGPGFDRSYLPDPRNPANIEQECGRGLLLIRTFMDEVLFNERGNSITLIKHAGSGI